MYIISKHVNSRTTTSAQRINTYVTSCTSSANISTHVQPQVHSISTSMSLHVQDKQTYQLTYHHKCTAYQHLCDFMYMNHKQTYQLTYHRKCTAYQHLYHFMYMNHMQTYQLTYHHECTAYQHLCHFMYMSELWSKQINSRTTASTQRINTYVTSCTSSANISTHVRPQVHTVSTPMWLHVQEKQTYQLTYHHKCTAYQHLCHFMYMNHKQTHQLTYHRKCTAYQHLCHFIGDEPWRAYYQERYHPPTPPEPPNQHPPYQHLCHFNEDQPP